MDWSFECGTPAGSDSGQFMRPEKTVQEKRTDGVPRDPYPQVIALRCQLLAPDRLKWSRRPPSPKTDSQTRCFARRGTMPSITRGGRRLCMALLAAALSLVAGRTVVPRA